MAANDCCPSCGAAGIKTKDTRPSPAGRIRRKRCGSCSHRWTTVEVPLELVRAGARAAAHFQRSVQALNAAEQALRELRAAEQAIEGLDDLPLE